MANAAHNPLKDFVGTGSSYIDYFIAASVIVTVLIVPCIIYLYFTQSSHYEESTESNPPNSEENALGSLTGSIEITQDANNPSQEETSMT